MSKQLPWLEEEVEEIKYKTWRPSHEQSQNEKTSVDFFFEAACERVTSKSKKLHYQEITAVRVLFFSVGDCESLHVRNE